MSKDHGKHERKVSAIMIYGVKSQQLSHLPGADMAKGREKGGHASRSAGLYEEQEE